MNKFKYTSLALSVALTSSPVLAQSELLTLYGKANVSFQLSDSDESATDLKSNNSRFGVKGEVELENGLVAIYQAEFGVDFSDESKAENITGRNQFVGLKGDFGQIRLGRMDTAFKMAQGKVDLFNDYIADIKNLYSGEIRANDTVTYISPKFSDFSFGVTYISQEENDPAELDSAGASFAVMYGDSGLKSNSLYGALAYDSDVKGEDRIRLVLNKRLGQFTVGTIIQRQENTDTDISANGALFNAAYKQGEFTYKVQHQIINDDSDRATTSIGIDYKLGGATKAFAWLTRQDQGNLPTEDTNTLAIGLEHKF
ncbi:porin [Catenovulum sp. 2E275]|uniref:porin n=1 Tax=Catenovulum sp. 2E275 TaxID=2980497 RepID=UPI0021D372DC|nr:porin [Catenovulum sp. 2E275]MCU4676161.1 porin [Catenovulum sp. 2E275]